jgi:hypothetical protein
MPHYRLLFQFISAHQNLANMKKAIRQGGKMTLVYSLFMLFAIMMFFTFGRNGEQKQPAGADSPSGITSVGDPNDPPIALKMTTQLLAVPTSQGNTLFEATFDDETVKSKMPDRTLTITFESGRVTLNDNGVSGDRVANDNVFSAIINDDPQTSSAVLSAASDEVLTPQLASADLATAAVAATQPATSITIFTGRGASVVPSSSLQTFSADDLSAGQPAVISPLLFSPAVDPLLRDRVLMIRELGVIEDPTRTNNMCCSTVCSNGKWTFGYLMSQIANTGTTGVSTLTLIQEWLDQWMTPKTVNTDVIAARTQIFNRVIAPWVRRSNPGAGVTTSNWKKFKLNMCFAPFRLLAIVPRFDLRNNPGYGGGSTPFNAGEGRFVFGIMDSLLCNPLINLSKGTVIFEYGLPFNKCSPLLAYAKRWFALKGMVPGTVAYNNLLDSLTDVFTKAGAATFLGKPNGSALNQIRTDEFCFGVLPWELREFTINATTKLLQSNTVALTPIKTFNRIQGGPVANQDILGKYVNDSCRRILVGNYTVPLTYSGVAFRGGKSHTDNPNTTTWDARNKALGIPVFINLDTCRHIFALGTCNGCHGGEGRTSVGNLLGDPAAGVNSWPSFVHIAPTACGFKPLLSAFLTGNPADPQQLFRITDPLNRPAAPPRSFNDLLRRAQDLTSFVKFGCGGSKSLAFDLASVLSFRPTLFPH